MFKIKNLAFCGLLIALATVTSFIKIFSFPFGGSVTLLSMLFIVLAGYFYGPKLGVLTAIVYGLLQLIIDPQVYYPMQVVMDYILAFGALSLGSFLWKKKHGLVIGYLIGVTGRFLFSSLSGYIFFAEYAWEGWSPILYALAYNGAYIYAETAITLVLLSLPPIKKAINKIKRDCNA
jgi:thiamine transporter